MEIDINTCDNCDSVSELTRVHIPTGKRGRPPIKFYCDDCLNSEKGRYFLPGIKAEKVNGEVVRIPRNLGGFSASCLYLLDLMFENLFEPIATNEWDFRCKGCSGILVRPNRLDHFLEHKSVLHH